MQSAGRSKAEIEQLRLRRMLCLRALRDRSVWSRAIRATAGIGAVQILTLRTPMAHHLVLLAMVPISTLVVAVASAVATSVRTQFNATVLNVN
jgi:hypothetical protein